MIEGWMGKRPRKWLKQQAKTHTRIVEVGVWKGKSTRILAKNTQGNVWAVDHWRGTPDDPQQHELYQDAHGAYLEFCENLRPWIADGTVTVVQMESTRAAQMLLDMHGPTFDMVFIDADHSYEAVLQDIHAWRQLVRADGILCGHDYKPNYPGVVRAVSEMFGNAAVIGPASIWCVGFDDLYRRDA